MMDQDLFQSGVAVVVPTYNEASGIEATVEAISSVLSRLPIRSKLIIVDDGSSDDTEVILSKMQIHIDDLEVLRHEKNRGYGAALVTGAKKAAEYGLPYVLFMDSDLTNDPNDIPRFVSAMSESPDVIKASRYIPGGGFSGVSFGRRAASWIGNLVARFFFGLKLHDYTNGFRAVRTELLDSLEFKEFGFAIIMEELFFLASKGAVFMEIPVTLRARDENRRSSLFSYNLTSLWQYLKYPIRFAMRRLSGGRAGG